MMWHCLEESINNLLHDLLIVHAHMSRADLDLLTNPRMQQVALLRELLVSVNNPTEFHRIVFA